MSVIPQWQEPTLGLGLRWGLDRTARPNWFMVPSGDSKEILLVFGRGKSVRSIHPRTADISHDGDDGQDSFFMVEGKMPGNARIEVRDPRTNALEAALNVSVKMDKQIGVAFNFCEDGLHNLTVRKVSEAQDMINDLNKIYKDQTNITFSLLKAAPLELSRIFGDIVREEDDIFEKGQKLGFAKLGQAGEWDKVFRTNADNGFNVYFVPADKRPDMNNTLVFTKGDNCIIEDGNLPGEYTLAHSIGRMLGCDFTSDPNRMNQLMFWDQGLGKKFMPRSDNFIPRDDANIMNP